MNESTNKYTYSVIWNTVYSKIFYLIALWYALREG